MRYNNEYGNSIFYIQNRKVGEDIIEYNLLSRLRRIWFKSKTMIKYYYVCGENKIFAYYNNNHNIQIKWNNKIIAIGSKKYLAAIRTTNMVGLILKYLRYGFLKSDETIKYINHLFEFVDVSFDNKCMIFYQKGIWYMMETAYFDPHLKCLLDKSNVFGNTVYHNIKCSRKCFSWMQNSSRFVRIGCCNGLILDIHTGAIFKNKFGNNIFDFGLDFLICIKSRQIYVCNLNFQVIWNVDCDYQFIGYHCGLRVLVTDDFRCFRVDLDHKLEPIILGKNYIQDRIIDYNQIMIMILHSYMLFDLLPYEILCVELYQAINFWL